MAEGPIVDWSAKLTLSHSRRFEPVRSAGPPVRRSAGPPVRRSGRSFGAGARVRPELQAGAPALVSARTAGAPDRPAPGTGPPGAADPPPAPPRRTNDEASDDAETIDDNP